MGIGVSSNVVAAAASLIGCSILTAPFNYLGVKVGSNMSRINSWDDVISKVSSRLSKWKLKLLSIGGRLTLLKSVLTSIPLYHMSIFKVPIGVLNHLESIRRNFFYGVDGSDRKLAWIGWNMVLTSKKNGGLGVSSFFAHNRALLFKWVWRFLTDGSSLWTRFIKAIFGNKGALDTHKLIPRRSPWQDVILAIHSLQSKGINLMDFIQKKVGNGENTSFWDDSWLGEVALKVLYKRLYALEMCKSISVAEKMGHPSLSHSFRRMPRGGVEQENYGLLCSKVADLVLPNISDRWCWSLEGSQEFSVKSSRILIDNTILPKAEVPTRWLRVVPIKVNVHAWRVCLDKLPTRANLSLRGMDIPSIACPLCNSAVESTSHIFFACPLARQVWRKFLILWELEDVAFNSYNEWLNWIVNIRLHKQLKVFLEDRGNDLGREEVPGEDSIHINYALIHDHSPTVADHKQTVATNSRCPTAERSRPTAGPQPTTKKWTPLYQLNDDNANANEGNAEDDVSMPHVLMIWRRFFPVSTRVGMPGGRPPRRPKSGTLQARFQPAYRERKLLSLRKAFRTKNGQRPLTFGI
ncbi:RNA-directed DNA polymerase, eukaryota, reverse transcriptase zinc-binding domain protein [Tanacetum coccineum]